MRLSFIVKFLVLAIFALTSFSLSPITAGEHPWDENQLGGGESDTTIISNGEIDPGNDNPEDPDNPGYDLFGTPLFWIQIIIDPPTGDVSGTAPSTNISGSDYDLDGAAIN